MDDGTEFEQLLTLLAGLPAGTEIRWGDDSTQLTPGVWPANWVDVYIPELCNETGWNWVWTITAPYSYRAAGDDNDTEHDVDEELDPTEILLPPDRTAWVITDTDTSWHRPEPVVVTGYDDAPEPSVCAEMFTAAAAYGEQVVERPSWSEAALNAALQAWCAEYAGRPDLRFRFDDRITTPLMNRLAAEIHNPSSSGTYQIAEGIEVSSSVFDDLLAMNPADAARITESIKQLFTSTADLFNNLDGTDTAGPVAPDDTSHHKSDTANDAALTIPDTFSETPHREPAGTSDDAPATGSDASDGDGSDPSDRTGR